MCVAEGIKAFLLYSLAVNYAILLVWFFVFVCFHHPLYTLHRRWFSLSEERFDAIHYGAMAFYKIIVITFNLVPLIVLSFFY